MTHNWNQQVPVATPEMIENLSESTLQGVRREGCFILRHVTEDIVECKAIQDGYVFQCPKKYLTSKKTVRDRINHVSRVQEETWLKEEIQKIKQDMKQKTEKAKLKRIQVKKDRYVTTQENKKKSASGESFEYESRGGARRLTTARNKNEERQEAAEVNQDIEQTISWSKTDPRWQKIKPSQAKDYLMPRVRPEVISALPQSREKGWYQKWREALNTYIDSQPGDAIDVPSSWEIAEAPRQRQRNAVTAGLDLSEYTVMQVYCDIETTGLSIYTSKILSIGLVCYVDDENLGEWESYVHTSADFPMASTDVHGIYPIDAAPSSSKLRDAPTLTEVNSKALDFLQGCKTKLLRRGLGKEIAVHLITWNGNTFDGEHMHE